MTPTTIPERGQLHPADAFRLLGFFDGPALVVLTNGFAKKSEAVPPQEIAIAQERKKDRLRRKA